MRRTMVMVVAVFLATGATGQALSVYPGPKVARFAVGSPGEAQFEQLTFTAEVAPYRASVAYRRGCHPDVTVRQLPSARGSLRVRLRDGRVLIIRFRGEALRVTGVNVRYRRTFRWRSGGTPPQYATYVPKSEAVTLVAKRFLDGRG